VLTAAVLPDGQYVDGIWKSPWNIPESFVVSTNVNPVWPNWSSLEVLDVQELSVHLSSSNVISSNLPN
jgi:hypothetical protein